MKKNVFAILFITFFYFLFGHSETSAQLSNKKKDILLHYEIVRARQAEKYDEAIDLCHHALLINPENSATLFELFLINAECNNHNEAFRYLKKAVANDKNNKSYNEYLTTYYTVFGNYNEAIEIALYLLKQEPFNEDYIQQLALLYSKTKQYKEAYKQFEILEKISGFNPELTIEKVKLLYHLNQDKKIVSELKKAINMAPNDSRFLALLGDHYLSKTNQNTKARTAYSLALSRNPKDDYCTKMIAFTYLLDGDTITCDSLIYTALNNREIPAIAKLGFFELLEPNGKLMSKKIDNAFEIILSKHSDDTQILTSAANYFLLKKDTTTTIKYLQQALEINPHQTKTWSDLMFLVGGNNINKYGKYLDDALNFNPKEPFFLYVKSLILNKKGEYKKALEYINKALSYTKNEPQNTLSTYWGTKGDLHYLLNQPNEAFKAFEESIKHNPANHLVLNNYAYFLALANQNLQKAEEMSSTALKLSPTNATYLDTYAWILYLRGEYALALFYIERALANTDEQLSEIYDHYGDILLKKGQVENAIHAWQQAVNIDNNNVKIIEKITKHKHENNL